MIAKNFLEYLSSCLGLESEDGVVISRYGKSRIAVFPIGIDAEKFALHAAKGRVPSRRVAIAAQPSMARNSRSASTGWIIPRG